MQIVGQLLEIGNDGSSLYIPWFHQGPLALKSGTTVFVGLTEQHARPVGDLIVSVVDPRCWERLLRIRCRPEDRPGILNEMMRAVENLMVVESAVTVTLDRGNDYEVDLLCEYRPEAWEMADTDDSVPEPIRRRLMEAGFNDISVVIPKYPKLVWYKAAIIQRGHIENCNWKRSIYHCFPKTEVEQVDLTRAVASTDTELGLFRFVFPRCGAVNVQIEHADVPGALTSLTAMLSSENINVLTTLSKRLGAKPGDAILNAVCEPATSNEHAPLKKRLGDELAKLDMVLRANLKVTDWDAVSSPRSQQKYAFISYITANRRKVDQLAEDLKKNGVEVWLDRDNINPGARWRDAIRRAIQNGDFFIAVFSKEYQRRCKTYMNEELTLAIEELRKRSTDTTWFIPVRVSDCEIPDRNIGAGETLRDLQYVDLHEDWNRGIRTIVSVIHRKSHTGLG